MSAGITAADMVSFLRKNMNLPDPDVIDSDERMSMTDEELLLYINIVLTKDYADYSCIEELPPYAIYPVKLLVQKELCLALAVRYAEDYDITADNNNQLKESQKFQQYLSLADHFDKLYNKYIDDGGSEGFILTSYDVMLDGRYYQTNRHYDKAVPPAIALKIKSASANNIEVSWVVKGLKHLLNYKIFAGEQPILDLYEENGKISKTARLITTIRDVHNRHARVTGLKPEETYYILAVVTEQNGLRGFSEIAVTTLPEEESEPDV